MMRWLGKLLRIEGLESIQDIRLQFAAPWAHNRPALVIFACAAAVVLSVLFYLRHQSLPRRRARLGMAVFRSLLLSMLIVVLAEPVVALGVRHHPRPLLLMLFDGTDSMNISDRLSSKTRTRLQAKLGEGAAKLGEEATRQDLVRAVLTSKSMNVLPKLTEKFRCRAYLMDQADEIRELVLPREVLAAKDLPEVAGEIRGQANVTSLGTALNSLRRRSRSNMLAGVVVVSDFNSNRGQPPAAAAERLKAPVYAVGVGPVQAVDLSVKIQSQLLDIKKDEKVDVTVQIKQNGLTGRTARVELLQRRMGTIEGETVGQEFHRAAPVQFKQLTKEEDTVTLTYRPDKAGRYTLRARVKAFDDEVLDENNIDERQVVVIDESLKLLFIEYEPTWEWRFVKEVFYRDHMIGREGFRTYLDSADFMVRREQEMFLETLVRSREEFFAYDVIFLSDVPRRMLSPHFQDMLREYVGRFGGGLVVIAGARFGPGELVDTKIADMLPVVLDSQSRRRDGEFALQLTAKAKQYSFMKLGDTESENRLAWANMNELEWYQQCLRPHPLATVLAEHPTDRCVDGKTPQPLIAIRRFGKGEVVYLAFNEMWRLRRMYGEKYYRHFWSQLIYRMGLSRALGSQKRFLVKTDRQTYQAGQKVHISVEAYNRSFEPLKTDRLEARLLFTQGPRGSGKTDHRDLTIPLSRDKVFFETSLPVFSTGPHRLLVKDPVTLDKVEATFKVEPTSAERRSAVRNQNVQQQLAEVTKGGKTFEIDELDRLADEIDEGQVMEVSERRLLLWNSWLVFALVTALMLGEWLARKLLNLQ